MTFRIHRTSEFSSENPPCAGARLEEKGDFWRSNKWVVDIDSLEALMKIVEAEGEIIISGPCHENNNRPEIEIYDDYRE